MELNPHDLIRIYNTNELLTDAVPPEWLKKALQDAPYGVVRRAVPRDGLLPVGVRGSKRSERFAAWIKNSAVLEVIKPERLVPFIPEKVKESDQNDVMNSLHHIIPILTEENLKWGPTGSAAFELATGLKVIKAESDLDLVIRCGSQFSVKNASALLEKLNKAALVRLDVQLDTPLGGVSLADYVNSVTVLVKTASGPIIVQRDTLWTTAAENELNYHSYEIDNSVC